MSVLRLGALSLSKSSARLGLRSALPPRRDLMSPTAKPLPQLLVRHAFQTTRPHRKCSGACTGECLGCAQRQLKMAALRALRCHLRPCATIAQPRWHTCAPCLLLRLDAGRLDSGLEEDGACQPFPGNGRGAPPLLHVGWRPPYHLTDQGSSEAARVPGCRCLHTGQLLLSEPLPPAADPGT